jgi:uncharacterized protein YbbC (DUF1343 family)
MLSNTLVGTVASVAMAAMACGCTVTNHVLDPTNDLAETPVRAGITGLLKDSIHLIAGKRVGILTNQTGINEKGKSDIDLLASDSRARNAKVSLVAIFTPEHGLEGTEDRPNVPGGVHKSTGVNVYSLYGNRTSPPPDSILQRLDVLVYDLQDIGTRTWTYVNGMVYAMRAAAKNGKKMIVLDKPNPITGYIVEGPMLDTTVIARYHPANGPSTTDVVPLVAVPMRHGMTMGEMALMYKDMLNIPVDLSVIPARGWQRDLWFDRTGLPWVKPSPNMPTLQSAMLYPGLVMFEATNLSVGRGTPTAFQLIGAPWLKAAEVVKILKDREMRGVRFVAEPFTPASPTDSKYPNKRIPGIRILITNRSSLQPVRVGATILWAINKVSPDSLRVNAPSFDRLLGSPRIREAIMRGEDPDKLMDREYQPVYDFRERTRKYLLYK